MTSLPVPSAPLGSGQRDSEAPPPPTGAADAGASAPSGGTSGKAGSASAKSETAREPDAGPDPVIGAGITLLGIFLMGSGGATDAHWVFDGGVLLAVLGAAFFVGCVALSAYKLRRIDRPSSS